MIMLCDCTQLQYTRAQNTSDTLSQPPPDNHHSSDVVYGSVGGDGASQKDETGAALISVSWC